MCGAGPRTNGSQSCPAVPGVSLTGALKRPVDDMSCGKIRRLVFVLVEKCVVSSVIESMFLGGNVI